MRTDRLSVLAIILLCSTLFLAVNGFASAQTNHAGVSKGETFDYRYIQLWTSTDPSATPPDEYVEYNNTQTMQFKITDVSGSVLSVDFIRHFKDGTQSIQSGTINIDSGIVTIPYGYLIIGGDLNKNQRVYPTGGYQTITDTVMRSYSSGQRETNVLGGEDSSQKTTIYFDKIKGIAVDYSYATYETSGSYNIVATEQMINTNSDDWATSTSTSTSTPNTQSTASPSPASGGTTTPTGNSSPTPSSSTVPSTANPSKSGNSIATPTPLPITESPLTLSTVIVGVVVTAIVFGAIALLLVSRKRKSRKVKESPKEKQDDFSLEGFELK